MNLREEIFSYIDSCLNSEGRLIESPETITDNLVAKIEKRIDEILKEEPYNTIDYAEGFARALRKVKEMLK